MFWVWVRGGVKASDVVSGMTSRPSLLTDEQPHRAMAVKAANDALRRISGNIDEGWNDDRRDFARFVIRDGQGDVLETADEFDGLATELYGALLLRIVAEDRFDDLRGQSRKQ